MVQPIGGKRHRKQIRLSQYTIDMVAEFGRRHGLNFGQAIERLALVGLQDTKADGMATLLADVVEGAMARSFNRFAKLIACAGLEAGAAKEAAQQVVFLHLLRLAEEAETPAALRPRLGVDPETPLGKEVVAIYRQRKQRFRHRAVRTLKQPVAGLDDILAEAEAYEQDKQKQQDGEEE